MKTNWQTKKLQDICEVFNGKTPSRVEQRKEGYPVLKIRNISPNGKLTRFGSFVDENFFNEFKDKALQKGDILILNAAHTSSYVGSKKYYWDKDLKNILPTGEWTIIRAKDWETSYFIYLWVLSSNGDKAIRNVVRGIHLYPKDVANLSVNIPNEEVKHQIVEKLDTIRKLQELNIKQISKIDELHQSLINEEIKSDKYSVAKISEITKPQEFINPEKSPNDEYQYVDISAVDSENLAVDLNKVKRFKGKDAPSRARKKIEKGDILFSTVRPNLKRIAIVDFPTFNSLASTGFAVLRPDSNKVNPSYMGTITCSGIITDQVLSQVRGAAYPAVSDNDIFNAEIPFPERKKQDEIAEKFIAVQGYKKNLIKQRELFKELFESTLSKLMRPN